MTEEAPLCECHGVPKLWHKDSRRPAGGYWECRVRTQQCKRERYHMNPEWRERTLRRNTARKRERYHMDPEYRERVIRRAELYRATEAGVMSLHRGHLNERIKLNLQRLEALAA